MQPQKEMHVGICSQTIDPASSSAPRLFSKTVPFTLTHRNRLFVLLFLATSAWFWQPLVELVSLTQREEHYSHMLLIPWVSLYVFYLDRTAILESKDWNPWLGSLLLGAGALSYAVNKPVAWGPDHLSLTMLAFVVMCWGIFLFCFGIRCFRRVSFGLLFLLFLVPLPSLVLQAIIGFLQRSSAEATSLLFSILGIPVIREGFVFQLSNFTVHIAEECSGIRSTLSLVLTTLVAGHLFLHSRWGRMSVVALVIPLSILKNGFRIVGLTLLANYVDPTYITNSLLHRAGGIPLFLLSLVVLFSLVWLLRRLEIRLGSGAAIEDARMGKLEAVQPRNQQA
ncbi:MAG: exosortase [Nitrospira sp.]|nr:exosortase [Nitrospira sp.]MBX3338087.1 exosortase [Nitrospira sp.]